MPPRLFHVEIESETVDFFDVGSTIDHVIGERLLSAISAVAPAM
jgi:hypothetical protein